MVGSGLGTKESPFTPGKPVPVEYFVARNEEIQRLERAIRQTSSGRNENVFITGERGIGKSSLAAFARYLAWKEYDLIGTHCFLGGVRSLEEMMGVVFQRLLQDCTEKSLFDRLKDIFRRYIKGVTLFGTGVEFTDDLSELRVLRDNFLPAIRKVHEEVSSAGKKGLVLVLDDLNGVTALPEFSQFLKSFVDSLATSSRPISLLFLLVGTQERREDLQKHQPSVGRIFDVVELSLMNEAESRGFFSSMFDKRAMRVKDDAMSLMVHLSGGYPMLMHEVGDAVFWQDTNGCVDVADARSGLMEAAQSVGRKYIGAQVASVFRNRTYSSILLRLGKKLPIGATFRRQDLLKEDAPANEQKNLDNFLNKVKKLGIMQDAETRGEYRFVNPLYHLYMWYEAKSKQPDR